MDPGRISPEAVAFRASFQSDDEPVDFDRIDEVRAETRQGYAAASDRAIERHQLEMSEVEFGGIRCSRIVSTRSGHADGRLFYVFGGAFITGDPYSDLPVIGALAEGARLEVIAPHYRLAPEHPAPAAIDDCVTAYAAAAEGVERLSVGGESAGGNLALLLAQRAITGRLRRPDALSLLSPAVDLRTDPELFEPTWGLDPSLHPTRMAAVEQAYLAGAEPTDPSVSPLFGPLEGLPPTIITTGTRDMFLSMSVRLARALRRHGVEVECHVWDGLWHVFEFYDELPEAAESLAEIAAFLRHH